MTIKETDLLVNLIEANAKANEKEHMDIVRRLDEMRDTVKNTLADFTKHCAKREIEVNKAIAAITPKKYTPYQSIRGVGRFFTLVLAQAAVTVSILAAFGVFTD